MANPFPGMDPYLEGTLWPVVHTNLATDIARALNALIRPKYLALSTQRVVVTYPDDEDGAPTRWPDVGVVGTVDAAGGGTAVATPPCVNEPLDATTIPQYAVEIRDPEDRRLVTAIEILSPTNKNDAGRAEYATKRREILAGPANLVEIDLLKAGTRFPMKRPLPDAPYFVFISRVTKRPALDVWPIFLREPIPKVPIPLGDSDPDVWLNLQAILDRLHDEMGYEQSVNYGRPPTATFTPDDLAWIDERLRAAGRRP